MKCVFSNTGGFSVVLIMWFIFLHNFPGRDWDDSDFPHISTSLTTRTKHPLRST